MPLFCLAKRIDREFSWLLATLTLANGFACPAPEFPAEITSTELNIFVWTEYISQDMRGNVLSWRMESKGNQQQYSSTDKMLEKLSTGVEEYDSVLPKDYAVPSMVRQGLLQELDHFASAAPEKYRPKLS